ncbi:MAG TPA: CHASE domain-containing protein, partial [Tepidisphaeraceae bacterium]
MKSVCDGVDSGLGRPARKEEQRLLSRLKYALQMLGVATAYFVAGKLTQRLAIPPGYATAVSPAPGLALAGVLLFGYRVLPGIIAGSIAVNIETSFDPTTTAAMLQSILLTTSIGIGAALQAVLGAKLVRRFIGFPTPLLREREVIGFLILAGPLASIVAPTWGVTSLLAARVLLPESVLFTWLTWWVGDTIGVMIFCPLALLFFGKPRHIWRPRRISVGLPLCLTFALAVLVFVYASISERNLVRDDFTQRSEILSQTLRRQINTDLEVERSVQGLLSVNPDVGPDQFRQFVASPLSRHGEIEALAWNPRVTAAGRADWERQIQTKGFGISQITERDAHGNAIRAKSRNVYFPVLFAEPEEPNHTMLGFDVASNPARGTAALRAIDYGDSVATRPVKLLMNSSHPWGIIVYTPVYRAGMPHATTAQRRRNAAGIIVMVFEL